MKQENVEVAREKICGRLPQNGKLHKKIENWV